MYADRSVAHGTKLDSAITADNADSWMLDVPLTRDDVTPALRQVAKVIQEVGGFDPSRGLGWHNVEFHTVAPRPCLDAVGGRVIRVHGLAFSEGNGEVCGWQVVDVVAPVICPLFAEIEGDIFEAVDARMVRVLGT